MRGKLTTLAAEGHHEVFFPKVSIVIPVFNGWNYLREAIESALAQTYRNKEVIVVNDGSEDGGKTAEIARSYENRIIYFEKPNGGVASALNFGIGVMAGEYFSWLSHDDAYHPVKLERQVEFLRKLGKKKVVLYGDFEIIDGQSKHVALHHLDRKIVESPLRAILSASIHGCSTLVPRAVFEQVGLFNERLRTVQDNDMWMRVHLAGFDFVHMPEVLIKSRVHPEQGQLTLGAVNKVETLQFYRWAFDALRQKTGEDERVLLEVLADKGVNLPFGVLRSSTKNSALFPWREIVEYKARLYLGKINRKMVQH